MDLLLKCDCGKVRGVASEATAKTGNRMLCYCDDCQAFAHFLERPDVLDAWGGSDVYQMAPRRLRITDGVSEIGCVRLGPKGLFRFYATCCRTPIANTTPSVPFVGILTAFIDHASLDEVLGKPLGAAYPRFATATPAPDTQGKSLPVLILRVLGLVLGWMARRKTSPSPFFVKKRPIVEPKVLKPSERALLSPAATAPHR